MTELNELVDDLAQIVMQAFRNDRAIINGTNLILKYLAEPEDVSLDDLDVALVELRRCIEVTNHMLDED